MLKYLTLWFWNLSWSPGSISSYRP